MRVALLTREYPPEIYGGAGVHVAELSRELRELIDVDVHCWGEPRSEVGVMAHSSPCELADANAAVKTLGIDLGMVAAMEQAAAGGRRPDVLHSHTWYANMAGHIGGLLLGAPHILSAHSLEPLRPWKAEQLGGGYAVSSWAERTGYEGAAAVVAVSAGMAADIKHCYPMLDPDKIHVIHNGIDPEAWKPVDNPDRLRELGIDPDRPSVAFVGRITRQKGVPHLLAAARQFDRKAQFVFCAGAPDTPELMDEVRHAVKELDGVVDTIWIEEMLPREDVCAIHTQASVFVCPSVYEPMGIVNLEAMACESAVVASRVGGIPEVVAEGQTGTLVDYNPGHPAALEQGLADAVNELLASPTKAEQYGQAGRRRAIEHFSWRTIAERTVELYRAVLAQRD